jgi:hypothetical protein
MAEKDVPAARRAADAAVQLASSPTERSEAERVQLLVTSLEAFWKGVEGAMKRLQSGRELEYGGKRVMVVEARPDLLAFREEGRMRLYAPADMPAELAVALAERSLKRQDPNVNLHVGSFLATDPRGDRDEARRRWEQSGELGKRFLAELRLPQ